mmetsp:Transcript_25936/g.32263  ORF Transcript_25936/g.32263 Transcript_25936/m.32263 type:complete len:170 (-) Transcript_25936:2086-2595(-)
MQQLNWMIMEMLEAAYDELYYAFDAEDGLDQTESAHIIAETNLIYSKIQSHFSKGSLFIHREIIARELTSQLGDRYPSFTRVLADRFEAEADQTIQLIDTKFDEMRQHLLSSSVKNKREAKRYIVKEMERAQLRKNESNMINAFKSFFKRAAFTEETKDDARPEFDTFE